MIPASRMCRIVMFPDHDGFRPRDHFIFIFQDFLNLPIQRFPRCRSLMKGFHLSSDPDVLEPPTVGAASLQLQHKLHFQPVKFPLPGKKMSRSLGSKLHIWLTSVCASRAEKLISQLLRGNFETAFRYPAVLVKLSQTRN